VKHISSTSVRAVLERELKWLEPSMRAKAVSVLVEYCQEAALWSPATDITGFADPVEFCRQLVVPTLRLASFISEHSFTRILDIGAGSGVGSLPLLPLYSTLSITCIEARAKAALFLEHCSRKLRLPATILRGRAETFARTPKLQRAFDLVVSRAVARFERALELALPFVCPGGACLFWRPHGKPLTSHTVPDTNAYVVSEPLRFDLGSDLPVAAWIVRVS